MRPWLALILLALSTAWPLSSHAADPTPDDTYDAASNWLCRPGRSDPCSADLTVISVAPDGKRTASTIKPDPEAPIDCFYVYPTISEAQRPNSTLQAGDGELRAVAHQFAPFASVCRPFAPVYRQVTLMGLRNLMTGQGGVDVERPIEDIRAAWRHYLAHDNQGRGVVLVGHSQGSRTLIELLRSDIDGKPEQKLLVSALLIGFNFEVPEGADAGGTLGQIPLCREAKQTGCVVAYSSFRRSAPPPANARFGRSDQPGTDIACVDPVALSGQPVRSLFPRRVNLLGHLGPTAWMEQVGYLPATFIDLPGLLTAECVKDGTSHYLGIGIDDDARGQRPPNIPGDLVVGGRRFDDWGLHLADVNLVLGNLLELVKLQRQAFLARW